MTHTAPVIEARGLSKRYGAQAVVQDVSFALNAGETLVLLGPSGCGKTTLLRMLNRLVEPDSGTIKVNGQDVLAQRPEELRRGIGYVIQQVGLLPHYTVAENIAVVPRLLGHEATQIATRTEELLTRLHLPPTRFANQYPNQLSGGQQQRVGLARALAADPPIVLLDEPFGALDPITRTSIRQEFRELPELQRKTIVLVTHDVTEAFELADRILLLDAGKVQQLGTPHELLFTPNNDFVRRFFDGERLALQLRTLRLADILTTPSFIQESPISTLSESGNNITSSTVSVHQALEHLNSVNRDLLPSSPTAGPAVSDALPEPYLWVKLEQETELGGPFPVTYSSLMTAFGHAVQRLSAV